MCPGTDCCPSAECVNFFPDLSLLPRLEADGMMTTVTTQREDVKIQREGRLEERVLQDG